MGEFRRCAAVAPFDMGSFTTGQAVIATLRDSFAMRAFAGSFDDLIGSMANFIGVVAGSAIQLACAIRGTLQRVISAAAPNLMAGLKSPERIAEIRADDLLNVDDGVGS